MNRELIVQQFVRLLENQTTQKFGKVTRDPVITTELPRTAFPTASIETVQEDITDLAFGNVRESIMQIAVTVTVSGVNRDTQRNLISIATESTIMADRTLGGLARDCALITIQTETTGQAEPILSFTMLWQVEYCYSI